MKDPRTGTWAVVGLILLLAGKLMLIGQIDPLLLIAAPIAGRWAMVSSAYFFTYARPNGLGGYFREGLGSTQLGIATLLSLAALVALASTVPLALATLFVAPLVGVLFGTWAARRLGGGLTGDCYGAICELTELLCLVVWVWLS
jgi:adenosylcobinamide-GDP ribazoletransferase